MVIRVSMHNHSEASPDSDSKISDMIKKCEEKKIDVLVVTDHNIVFDEKRMKGINTNVKVIPAVEASTKDDCHFLGLFVNKDIPYLKLTGIEVVRKMKAQGAIVIMAHPFRKWQGWLGDQYKRTDAQIKEILKEIDGVEIYNAKCTPQENKRAKKYFENFDLAKFGGADAHTVNEIGNVIVELASDSENIRNVLLTSERKIKVDKLIRLVSLSVYYFRRFGKFVLKIFGMKEKGYLHKKLRKKLYESEGSFKKSLGKK